jgi:hypothetical protein
MESPGQIIKRQYETTIYGPKAIAYRSETMTARTETMAY